MTKFQITIEDTCYATFDVIAPDLAEARILAEKRIANNYDFSALDWKRNDDDADDIIITSVTHRD